MAARNAALAEMRTTWPYFAGLLLALLVALALRCVAPDVRPFHNDEGVNAVKFAQLSTGSGYKYDPNEHHGPSLPYATLVLARLTGAAGLEAFTDARFRLVDVLFGVGLILLLPLVADGLGRRATLCAALLTALSPAMVFYSRYYIHEMPLVFFALLAGGAGWRYWQTPRLGWAVLAGVGVGLMQATKETFVLSLAAAVFALSLNWIWSKWLDASAPPQKAAPIPYGHLGAALLAWGLVTMVLFSSFFTNADGILDSIRTYKPWLSRAGGASPHIHPWGFYFERLLWFRAPKGPLWTEAFIAVLALVGAVAGFTRRHLEDGDARLIRFLTFYTCALTAGYCLIAYKTPWCLLSFWHGAILLAGLGAVVILRSVTALPVRAAAASLLLAGIGHLAAQAWRAAVPMASSPRNPYVYAQTLPGALELVEQVRLLADLHPDKRAMLVKVIAPGGDYWPLPWYFHDFSKIGWWETAPADPYAPVMIVAATLHAGLDEAKTHQMPRYYEFRPGVFFEVYVQTNLWRTYLENRPAAKTE